MIVGATVAALAVLLATVFLGGSEYFGTPLSAYLEHSSDELREGTSSENRPSGSRSGGGVDDQPETTTTTAGAATTNTPNSKLKLKFRTNFAEMDWVVHEAVSRMSVVNPSPHVGGFQRCIPNTVMFPNKNVSPHDGFRGIVFERCAAVEHMHRVLVESGQKRFGVDSAEYKADAAKWEDTLHKEALSLVHGVLDNSTGSWLLADLAAGLITNEQEYHLQMDAEEGNASSSGDGASSSPAAAESIVRSLLRSNSPDKQPLLDALLQEGKDHDGEGRQKQRQSRNTE